jgi:sulfatase modifying factor 1
MSLCTLQTDDGPEGSPQARPPGADMVRIPDGTFRMGSDKHYAEEMRVHRVTVAPFWMDRTPVTNR